MLIFFPQAVFETPSFTGKSFGWGSQVLGGCFTIMMCNVFGSFWGVGGFWGDAFKLMSGSYEETLAVLETFFPKRCSRLRLLPVRALGGGRRFLSLRRRL